MSTLRTRAGNYRRSLGWVGLALLSVSPGALAVDDADLAALLEQAKVELRVPGLRAAMRLPDGQVVKAAVGFSNVKAETPLDNTIAMPGGSTGMAFVAALTMLLVEDGTLALDDHASKWPGDTSW